MGDTKNFVAVLKVLIEEFPESKPALLAKRYLEKQDAQKTQPEQEASQPE